MSQQGPKLYKDFIIGLQSCLIMSSLRKPIFAMIEKDMKAYGLIQQHFLFYLISYIIVFSLSLVLDCVLEQPIQICLFQSRHLLISKTFLISFFGKSLHQCINFYGQPNKQPNKTETLSRTKVVLNLRGFAQSYYANLVFSNLRLELCNKMWPRQFCRLIMNSS